MGIEIKDVNKSFGQVKALNQINLIFKQDTIYGLLGRNGAGKSTLLNIISNRIYGYDGEVLIDGLPARENDKAQSLLYLMSEDELYPQSYSLKKAMLWTKAFYGGFDLDSALSMCELYELDPKKKFKTLSTGYKSIFKLIIALNVEVPYIFLDEPVLGLDANHRELFYKLLMESYGKKPRTFIISTHLIEEISNLIEEIIIVKKGEIIQNLPCEDLLARGYTASGSIEDVNEYVQGKKIIGEEVIGGLKLVYIMEPLNRNLVPKGIQISKLDLQKLFIQLTNH